MATTVPTQQTFLRTYSWEATPIAFSVVKVTVATLEGGREEKKQEQLAYSCPIYIKQVWADSSGLVIIRALARADSITIVIMQPGNKYRLCEGLEAHMSVGHKKVKLTNLTGQVKKNMVNKLRDTASPGTCSLMYDKANSIRKYHTYTNANKHHSMDKPMQVEDMFVVYWDQGTSNKTVKEDQHKTSH